MENRFEVFFRDKNYLKVKNSLFNYLNRKTQIKKAFFQHNTFKNILGLDIGSGISPVSPIPKKTVFMDLSESGVNFLKNQGYNAEVGNITDLKLKKDSFNWIFCRYNWTKKYPFIGRNFITPSLLFRRNDYYI